MPNLNVNINDYPNECHKYLIDKKHKEEAHKKAEAEAAARKKMAEEEVHRKTETNLKRKKQVETATFLLKREYKKHNLELLTNKINIGIDFGTSFSYISRWDEPTKKVLSLVSEKVPTVIYYDIDNNNKIVIGQEAEKAMSKKPENGRKNIKNWIKNDCLDNDEEIGEGTTREKKSRKNIIVGFLDKLITTAVGGQKDIIGNIIVSVPVKWKLKQINSLITCIHEASDCPIANIKWIHEPVAAALNYFYYNDKKDGERILVYDLGGGTFDVAIVEYKNSEYEVIATDEADFAGNKFDEALLDTVIIPAINLLFARSNLLRSSEGKSIGESFISYNNFKTQKEVITAKEKLSSDDQYVVTLNSLYKSHIFRDNKVSVTRHDFEKAITQYVDITVEKTNKLLKKNEVNKIVLSGGSSQIPLIKEKLNELKVKIIPGLRDEDLARAISFGAAIYAAHSDDTTFITPYSYAACCLSGQHYIIIEQGMPFDSHDDGKYVRLEKIYSLDTRKEEEVKIAFVEYAGYRKDAKFKEINKFERFLGISIPSKKIIGSPGIYRFYVIVKLFQGEPELDVEVFYFDQFDENGERKKFDFDTY